MHDSRAADAFDSTPAGCKPIAAAPMTSEQPSAWRSFLTDCCRTLVPTLWLLLAWVVMFQLLRVLLIVATWSHHGDATLPLISESLLRGLRFDVAIAF